MSYKILAVADSYFSEYVAQTEALQAKIASLSASDYDPEEKEQSRLLNIYDNVAVIDIKGGLTNEDSYWNKYFGLVSYGEIREAIIQAVEAEAQAAVFNVDSGGGAVAGMNEVGELISNLQIPTISHTSASMCSAMYFICCQADHVYAGDFSTVGSIGVVAEMYDRTKMLDDIGIKPIRFRSGNLKAVGSPNFKLSKEELTYLQDRVMTYAHKFYNITSDARGMPVSVMETYGITSGRTYIGDESLKVNLIDEVKTFDEVMLKAFNLTNKDVDNNTGNSIFSQ